MSDWLTKSQLSVCTAVWPIMENDHIKCFYININSPLVKPFFGLIVHNCYSSTLSTSKTQGPIGALLSIVKPSVVTDTFENYTMESTHHHYHLHNVLFILQLNFVYM